MEIGGMESEIGGYDEVASVNELLINNERHK